MDVKYDYSLNDLIDYGIKDNQTVVDAIVKEALPILPVHIKVPSFGCTAFCITDTDQDVLNKETGSYTVDTAWEGLQATQQLPNPEDVTSNTQWSIVYNDTDLTAQIVLRRHWEDMTEYNLTTNTVQNLTQ